MAALQFIVKFFPEITIKSKPVRRQFVAQLARNVRAVLRQIDPEVDVRRDWDKLMVVSVGTGTSSKGDHNILKQGTGVKVVAKRLVSVAGAMIQATMVDQDTCCRQVGRCVYGADLDRETDGSGP